MICCLVGTKLWRWSSCCRWLWELVRWQQVLWPLLQSYLQATHVQCCPRAPAFALVSVCSRSDRWPLSSHGESWIYCWDYAWSSVCLVLRVWIMGEPAAYGVYMRARNGTKHLCGCFKWSRQGGPILPTWRHHMFLVRVLCFCWPRSVHSSKSYLIVAGLHLFHMMTWPCIMPRFVVHELLFESTFLSTSMFNR